MKPIKKLLKQSKKLDGSTKVELQLQIPLKKLRANHKLLKSLGAANIKILGGKNSQAKPAKTKTNIEQAAKKAAQPKRSVSKSKAATGASAKVKTTARKVPAKRTAAATVSQAAVLAALGAGSGTSQTVAAVIKASPAQVSRALSRYSRQGLIVRTAPGQYALKPS